MFIPKTRSKSAFGTSARTILGRRVPVFALSLLASSAIVQPLALADAEQDADTAVLQTTQTSVSMAVDEGIGNVAPYTRGLWSSRTRELIEVDNREIDEVAERLKRIIKARYEAENANAQSLATIEELRLKIAELEALLRAAGEQQERLESGAAQLADYEQTINALQAELAELTGARNAEQARAKTMQNQLADLNGLLSQQDNSLGLFKKQLGENEVAYNHLQDQIDDLARERDSARAEVAGVEELLENKSEDLADVEAKLVGLSSDHKNALQKINDLQKNLADSEAQVNSFHAQRDDLTGELSLFENKVAESANAFVAEQQAHTQTRANMLALQREAEDLRRNVDRLYKEREALGDESNQLMATRDQLNGQLAAVKAELENRHGKLNAALDTVDSLNGRIDDLTMERDELGKQVQTLGAQVVTLNDNNKASVDETQVLREQIAAKEQSFLKDTQSLQAEVAGRDQGIEKLKSQIADLGQDFGASQRQANEKIRELEKQVAGLSETRDQLNLGRDNDSAEIARLNADIESLVASNDASSAELDKLRLLNEQLNQDVKSGKNTLQALKVASAEQLAGLEQQILDLSGTRDTFAQDIARLESINNELSADLQENRSSLDLLGSQSSKKIKLIGDELRGLRTNEAVHRRNAQDAQDQIQHLSEHNQNLQGELEQSLGKYASVQSELGEARDQIGVYEAELDIATQKTRDLLAAQELVEQERDRIAAESESLRTSLTEELELARIENITVQKARADNSIPIRLGNADFFETGSATLTKAGGENLTKLAEIIHNYHDKRIVVEGHTDTVPIGIGLKFRYESNWELSVARAAAAVRHMQNNTDIDPTSLTASGFGEYMPVADNSTPDGRQQNRRVEVVLYPSIAEIENYSAIDE